jgi:hypothetical protein
VFQCDKLSFPKILVLLVFAIWGCQAQETSNDELARLLATPGSREAAIDAIRNSASDKIPLLLSWTTTSPRGIGVSREALYIGLADAFGTLKISAAIPFLIKYISLTRTMSRPNIWWKSEEAILTEFPAMHALVQMGTIASDAIIKTQWVGRSSEERLLAIFAVAQIADPGARDFLARALGEAKTQQDWASEGLRRVDKK